MQTLIAHLKNLEEDEYIRSELLQFASTRWMEYHSSLHAAAYILDPEFQGGNQESEMLVMQGWNEILEKLVPDDKIRREIKFAWYKYRVSEGLFATRDAKLDRFRVNATLWWEENGAQNKELQALAIKVLSQSCSSSAIERLFSTMGDIITKKRNRLSIEKTNDLAFVAANMRLIELASKLDNMSERFIGLHKEESIPPINDEDDGNESVHDDDDDVEDIQDINGIREEQIEGNLYFKFTNYCIDINIYFIYILI